MLSWIGYWISALKKYDNKKKVDSEHEMRKGQILTGSFAVLKILYCVACPCFTFHVFARLGMDFIPQQCSIEIPFQLKCECQKSYFTK